MPELHQLFGSTSSITWWQTVLRAVLIFFYLLLLLRLGPTRALGKLTAFDTVVGVTLGSTLSRCMTGNSPLVQDQRDEVTRRDPSYWTRVGLGPPLVDGCAPSPC